MTTTDDKYPLLSKIDSPADLRRLDEAVLPQLCAEIRAFLIEQLSEHPGHFASSMGSVELTVALHYVFDTPYDRIVWDVGHQAYGHKLLTGRRDRFDTNRTFGGLSGFPTPAESEYDTFTAGHASNSISAALGMSVASLMKGETPRRKAVAVIGDASISGGLAFEGLNNAANTPNNMLIVLNDNDMSIDDNVGSLSHYLTKLSTSRRYNNARYKAYNWLRRHKCISEDGRGRIMRFNNSLKSLLAGKQNIFEGLDIRYFGPFDGHDIHKIIKVLRDIKDMEGPRILHLRTVKGKGFPAAEKNPAEWHAPGRFDPVTGEKVKSPAGPDTPKKFQDVFGNTLLELATKDSRIMAITAAMSSGTSISIMQKQMPERVFDTGISEGHAVTFAGGLASQGLRPVVGIYSSFLQRAYDNIIHDVAIQSLPVVFCIDRAGLVGDDGMTHHGSLDLAYLNAVPNMIVSAPADEHQLRNLMLTALSQDKAPFAIRYPRGQGSQPCWQNEMQTVEIGKSRRLSDGDDVAVLTIGTVATDAAGAVAKAREDGVNAAHYDMVFLKPIDTALLDELGAKGIPVVTVEDGTLNGGLASVVSSYFIQKGYPNKVTSLGIPDQFVAHGTVSQLKNLCGFDTPAIHRAITTAAKSAEK